MDEDLLAFLFILLVLISLPFTFAATLTACIAYSRTKAWDKQRRLAPSCSSSHLPNKQESARLVNGKVPITTTTEDEDSDSDSEFYYDTEDEQELRQRRAEDEADRFLTFGQKFRKEVRGVWRGDGVGARAQKEERRKVAKAVVREMEWRERRREKMGRGGGGLGRRLFRWRGGDGE